MAKGIGRFLVALIASWWAIGFVVAGVGMLAVGSGAAAAEIWVLGLAVVTAFWLQGVLPFWQD